MTTKQDHLRLIMADYDHEELEAAQDWISRLQDQLAEERAARETDREASESTRRERDIFMNALMRLWIGMGHGGSLDCDVLVVEALERLKAAQPAAEPAVVDLVAWIEAQREFSLRAFGPGTRTEGNLRHIAKELDEIRKDPSSLTERIDVVILALDGAWRAGFEPREIADALWAKLEVNKSRSWPDWRTKREDEPIEHVEAAQPAAEAPAALSRAESDILAERTSQRSKWGVEHDDEHLDGELANAAMAYISSNHKLWPFADGWKPRSRREDLVRAAALLIAEIERLDRRDESFQAPEVRAMHAAEAPAPIRTFGTPCSMEIIPASAEAPAPAEAQEFTREGCYFRRNGADWLRIVDGSNGHHAIETLRLLNAGLEAESRALTAAARARDAIVKRFESAGIAYPQSGSPDEAAEAVIAQAVRHAKRVAELESIAEDQESKLADLDRTCAHQKSRIESAERLVADLRSQLRTFAWVPPMPERVIPLDQETLKWSVLAGHCADLRAGIAIPDRESEEWREGLAAARERIAKAEAEERASRAGGAS